MKMKKALCAVLALIMVFSFAACGKENDTKEGAEKKDTLIVRLNLQMTTFDPQNYPSSIGKRVSVNIFDPLVVIDEEHPTPSPLLADSWELSEDGITYTFKLHEGIKFHNGEDLTASDVKFSYDRAADGTTLSPYIAAIDKVEVVDDYTVKMILKYPDVAFLTQSVTMIPIMDEQTLSQSGYDVINQPVGCGPYKFVSFDEANQTCYLEAYEDYFRGEAPIKYLQFKAITDSTAAALALQAGDISYAMTMDSNSCLPLENDDSIVIESAPTAYMTYVMFNCAHGQTTSKALRQAISYAIDKEAINMVVSDGNNLVANEYQYPDTIGYKAGSVMCYEYNPEKAKEILKEAGLENIELSFISDRDYVQKLAEVIQDNLKDVGITLTIDQLDAAGYDDKVYGKTYELGYWSFGNNADVDEFYNWFHSTSSQSVTYYNNPAVDELLTESRREQDPEKREEIITQMLTEFKEDPAMIPLYFATEYIAYPKGLKVGGILPVGNSRFYYYSWE